jgi:hypothetical protein
LEFSHVNRFKIGINMPPGDPAPGVGGGGSSVMASTQMGLEFKDKKIIDLKKAEIKAPTLAVFKLVQDFLSSSKLNVGIQQALGASTMLQMSPFAKPAGKKIGLGGLSQTLDAFTKK